MSPTPRHLPLATAIAFLPLLLAGCGDDPADAAAAYPDAVTCRFGGDFSGSLTAEAVDGEAVNPGVSGAFGSMTFTLVYTGEAADGGHTVRVEVTDGGGAELLRVLYQIGTPLDEIEFVGGHGFTGLHYVSHGGEQLQFWCEPG